MGRVTFEDIQRIQQKCPDKPGIFVFVAGAVRLRRIEPATSSFQSLLQKFPTDSTLEPLLSLHCFRSSHTFLLVDYFPFCSSLRPKRKTPLVVFFESTVKIVRVACVPITFLAFNDIDNVSRHSFPLKTTEPGLSVGLVVCSSGGRIPPSAGLHRNRSA